MSTNYDAIADVSIDVKNPIVLSTNDQHILIVGPSRTGAPATDSPALKAYTSIRDMVEDGWTTATDPVYLAASVAFAQTPTPEKIYVAAIGNTTTTTTEGTGDDAVTTNTPNDTALDAIKRAMDNSDWYIICTAGVATSEYSAIASYIESTDRLFVYTELGFFGATSDSCQPTVSGDKYRTIGIYARPTTGTPDNDIPTENNYANVALASKWLSYQPGSETVAFKNLNQITPSKLTSEEIGALKNSTINYYITVGNHNTILNGKVLGNEWCDVIRFRDWLKNDMTVRVVNLFLANPKIPYNDAGIGLVHNQMLASLKEGQNVGGIAEDEYDEDGELIPGFETSVPTLDSIADIDRKNRTLSNLKFTARLAGAIHFTTLTGSLTY